MCGTTNFRSIFTLDRFYIERNINILGLDGSNIGKVSYDQLCMHYAVTLGFQKIED